MPYGYQRGNYRNKKRRYGKPKKPMRYKVADMAYKGWKMALGLRKLINVEWKYHNQSATLNPSTGTVTHLSNIGQGDDNDLRSGRSILLKSVYLQAVNVINASAANTTTRVIIFVDHDAGGVSPTVTDVLQTASIISARNLDTDLGRFTILMDKCINLSDNGNRQITIKKYIPMNIHIKYDGTASTDFSKNNIWMITLSSEPTNTPEFSYNLRLRYIDN